MQIRDADSGLVVFERVTTETLDEDRQSVPGTLTPVGDLDLPPGSYAVSAVVLACGEASPCATERTEREAYEEQGCAGEFSVGDAARAGLIVNPPLAAAPGAAGAPASCSVAVGVGARM